MTRKHRLLTLRFPLLLSLMIDLWAYDVALRGYQFPRDHFNHPNFRTEWWYYTGNLKTQEGRQFGFQLTFFRQAVTRPEKRVSAWDLNDLYVAHLALSDIDAGKFYHTKRLNRAGPGLAGADLKQQRVWNGNWQVRWVGDRQSLQGRLFGWDHPGGSNAPACPLAFEA